MNIGIIGMCVGMLGMTAAVALKSVEAYDLRVQLAETESSAQDARMGMQVEISTVLREARDASLKELACQQERIAFEKHVLEKMGIKP